MRSLQIQLIMSSASGQLGMRLANASLEVETSGQGLTEITSHVRQWSAGQHMANGLLTLYCQHTSASLIIQENVAPAVRADLLAFFERIAPEFDHYTHDDEGPDDMPAHIKSALTQTSLSIPILNGKIALGQWQGIYLFEHRRKPQLRTVVVQLIGS